MNTERIAAQQLASYGRYGDTMLLHVNPLEVAGIASLVPGGLTTNPVTGLPEAFFFLPFLASMFSAAAPAAAAATAGAAAAGATAAGGLAAGGALAGGLGAGLASTIGAGALTPALTAGTGLLASAAPAAGTIAATAAPAVTGGLGSLLGAGAATPALAGMAPAVASAAPAALAPGAIGAGLSAGNAAASGGLGSLLSGGTNTLLGGAGVDTIAAAPPVFAPGGGMPSPLATPGGQSYAMGAGPTVGPPPTPPSGGTVLSGPKTGMLPPGPPTTGPAGEVVLSGPKTGLPVVAGPDAATGPGMLDKLGNYFSKNPMMALAGLQALKGLIPAGGKKKEKSNYRKGKYQGGPPVAAPAGFQHGIEPEHNYFPGYSNLYANNGGLVGYAEGGLVDPQAQKPQDMSFPLNGVPGGGGISDLVPEEIPSSPFPTEQIGSEPEPGADPAAVDTSNDKELVMQMVEVIQGKHPNPEPVIKAFVQEFGEQALQDLAMRVKQTTAAKGGPAGPPPGPPMPSPGGPSPMDMVGPPPQMGPPQGGPPPQGFAYGGPVGDGLSDSVPAKLSVGEFVVPADAVSGLGNGSTDAGAQHLQGMVNNVRMARGGSVQQPAPIRGGIAAMMNGGLVQGYKRGGRVKAEPEEEVQYYMPLLEPDQRTRTEHIWDFANPPKVIPDSPYSQGWSDSIHELQKAKRYLLENNIQ